HRAALETHPELRIVATSHSPYLVDALEPDEVWVVRNIDGESFAKRLSDHPDAAEWVEDLGTGAFWAHVGEDWVTRP
ncbi:MAG: ATP-binding protein, partial [Myxococcota bacterium]